MEPNQIETPVQTAPIVAPKAKSYGGLIAIIIVLVAVVVGAFYFWGERIAKEPKTPEGQLNTLEMQGTSTDTASIEADLEAQSADDFEKDLDNAFNELDASFEAQ